MHRPFHWQVHARVVFRSGGVPAGALFPYGRKLFPLTRGFRMTPSQFRRDATPDPVRQGLVEVRRGLLRLHKLLIDSERATFERGHGAMSNGQFLQALIQDPYFEWLRPFTGLIVEIDELLATREPVAEETARGYAERARGLVEPPDAEAAGRYEGIRNRDPEILIAHVELTGRIGAVVGGAPGEG